MGRLQALAFKVWFLAEVRVIFSPLSPLCCIAKNGCGPHTASCLLCVVGSDELTAVWCNSLTMCGTLPAATFNWSLQWNASYSIMLCLHSMLAVTVVDTFFSGEKCIWNLLNTNGLILHIHIQHIWPPVILIVLKFKCWKVKQDDNFVLLYNCEIKFLLGIN